MASKKKQSFEFDISDLSASIPDFEKRLDRGVRGVILQRDSIVEKWMKLNAPWRDRTGNARAELTAKAESVKFKTYDIVLSHGPNVPYGIWLELARAGKWGIIRKTLEVQSPKVMSLLEKFINRLGSPGGVR